MKRHRRDLEVMSDLNLTNMIDTAFVLLIVFILVAPAMKNGLDLDLPKVSGDTKPTDENKTLTIGIKKGDPGHADQIISESKRLTIDELKAAIATKQMTNKKLQVVIEADRASTYDTFAQVVGVLKDQGVESIGLITDPAESSGSDADKTKLKPVTAH